MITEVSDKAIRLTNKTAVRLAKQRALREGRSASNAAAQTIIEHLSENGGDGQEKNGAETTGTIS